MWPAASTITRPGQQGPCMVTLPGLLPGLQPEHRPSPQRRPWALTQAETHSGQGELLWEQEGNRGCQRGWGHMHSLSLSPRATAQRCQDQGGGRAAARWAPSRGGITPPHPPSSQGRPLRTARLDLRPGSAFTSFLGPEPVGTWPVEQG